jgi:hypothetical protein
LLHLFLYPVTSLGQVFVPPLDFISLADRVTRLQYPYLMGSPVSGLLVQSAVLDLLSVALTAALLFALVRAAAGSEHKKLFYFSLAWAAASFVPYAVLERSYSYLESRYYYGALPGLGIALGIVGARLWVSRKTWARALVAAAAVAYLVPHVLLIRREISGQVLLARERKPILAGFEAVKPRLGTKNVVLVTGSRSYVLPQMPVPFQQGLGYTLMVLFSDTGKIPRNFLEREYLWNIQDDGYREEGGLGFGYYFDEARLRAALKQNKLGPENVFSFRYDGEKRELVETTEQVRVSLRS